VLVIGGHYPTGASASATDGDESTPKRVRP
jgi:hypothetical protein